MVRWCLVCLQQNVLVCLTGSSVGVPDPRPQTAALCPALRLQRRAGRSAPCPPPRPSRPAEGHRGSAPAPAPSAGADIHLELGPPEGSLGSSTAARGSTGRLKSRRSRHQTHRRRSPPPQLAPNPQLTYVDRVGDGDYRDGADVRQGSAQHRRGEKH